MKEKQLRLSIYNEAVKWLNTPWIHHHSVQAHGCDCIGLVIGVGNNVADFNFSWKDPKNKIFKGYSRTPDPKKMKAWMLTNLDKVSPNYIDAKIGDILWMRVGKHPQHVAIVGPKEIIIHADIIPKPGASTGKVVERTIRHDEKGKVIGVYRYRSVSRLM